MKLEITLLTLETLSRNTLNFIDQQFFSILITNFFK